MSIVKITHRCLEEDLPALPKPVQIDFFERIRVLETAPQFGKILGEPLHGFRRLSLGRYRIVHYYQHETDSVWIIAVGIRKQGARRDIYAILSALVRAGRIVLE
jgi:mRNA-degrading endonuclease RelE of RelBE toxin-antitoxin system